MSQDPKIVLGDEISQSGSGNVGKVVNSGSGSINMPVGGGGPLDLQIVLSELSEITRILEEAGLPPREMEAEKKRDQALGIVARSSGKIHTLIAAIRAGASAAIVEAADDPKVAFVVAFIQRHLESLPGR